MKPLVFAVAILILLPFSGRCLADNPTVKFTIDAQADVKPISRFIYGINHPISPDWWGATLTRLGGNRWTAYNWTNNASNAGNDYRYQNDAYLRGGDDAGGAMIPGITNAHDNHAGIILTVPMAGYVSADKRGDGDVRSSGADYLTTRFRPERAMKNAPFTLTPEVNSPVVFEDEMVNWTNAKFPWGQSVQTPIWFMLDNEPALWSQTHAEIHSDKPSYAEMVRKTIEYSLAIKNVAPHTLIFGPASYGWNGMATLQDAPDAQGRDFLEFYLKQLAAAERETGKRLLDVLDVHWYPEVRTNNVRITEASTEPSLPAARVSAPRSLWDTSYTEESWIAKNLKAPIALIPRLIDKITRDYPGTKLSISEYNYGGGNDISGAIAEADVLGIFGRSNVFAACEWPMGKGEPFTAAGFRMFRDFDGHGATFGDKSVSANTDNPADTSIYASVDSAHRLFCVAINRADHPIDATMELDNAPAFDHADLYQLSGTAPTIKPAGSIQLLGSTLSITLPPMSITTIKF